uniref:Costars domain-containing protein n=1 Tax=Plectus sambesii TaxID=2011161 RepID=A0A914XEM1_9BILA
MLVKRCKADFRTIILSVSVATVDGYRPLVGFSKEVEEAWAQLKKKFGIKEKSRLLRRKVNMSASVSELDKLDRLRMRRGSDTGEMLNKFRQMDAMQQASSNEDVYSANWRPPKFDKNAPDYGRPKAGSLTERRGIKAGHHIGKQIIRVCEVITECGTEQPDGTVLITFGKLFSVYQYISDKIVGLLLRARKHKLVSFEGEMLFQRRDEDKLIVLLKPLEEVRALYEESDDPAYCLLR